MKATFLLLLLFVVYASRSTPVALNKVCEFEDSYPPQYVVQKLIDETRLTIDGRLDEPEWIDAPWTDDFVDISTDVVPRYQTRVKMLWDDEFLYVGAKLMEQDIWANISHTCHCNDTKDDQVIFHDNDFEIFIDPSGSNHHYKEFEMNAHNQDWNLLLNKPYLNGGFENSSRVLGKGGFDMTSYGLRHGVFIDGKLNDPCAHNKFWTVEVALPIKGLMHQSFKPQKPTQGSMSFWRINFSRVEWKVTVHANKTYWKVLHQPEDNWVWAPIGLIDIHLPERWGLLQFASSTSLHPVRNKEWTIRQVAMTIYYAQMEFYDANNKTTFAKNVNELVPFLTEYPSHRDERVILGACTSHISITVFESKSFLVCLINKEQTIFASIDHERLLMVDGVRSKRCAKFPSVALSSNEEFALQ